jgi:hypothetical protein
VRHLLGVAVTDVPSGGPADAASRVAGEDGAGRR